MIKSLKLTNFRQFTSKKISFNSNIVVIVGNNTKGKSTILEGIYYLTNGYSPWADNGNIVSYDDEYFRIDGEVEQDGETSLYSIFKDRNKRNLQIEKKNTNSKRYFKNLSSTLFSPELIEILLISPSKRREFIDTFCCTIDPEYKEELERYKKILRQRNGYIKRLSKHFYETGILPQADNQYKYWSKLLSESSAKLLYSRLKYIEDLKQEDFSLQYRSNIDFGDLEDLLDIKELTTITNDKLEQCMKRDIALGHSTTGVHRDDWDIINGKDVKRYGSRGEKRLAIIKLIYLTHKVVTQRKGYSPYLLLDDIPSELDDDNIGRIFDIETLQNQQTFITAIRESEIPAKIIDLAQVVHL